MTLKYYALLLVIYMIVHYFVGAFIQWDFLWYQAIPSWSILARMNYLICSFLLMAAYFLITISLYSKEKLQRRHDAI